MDRIGERIKAWRRRRGGMSQTALAGLSGLSQAYISQLENGERPLDRKHTQVKIAHALNITVAQLTGLDTDTVDPVREQALVHVPAIRSALVELSAGETRAPVRDADQVRAAVRELTELRNAADYAGLAPMLPGLLTDLAGHGEALTPEYIEALFCTRYSLRSMGLHDLAREASELGIRAAQLYGDAAWSGQAIYSWVQAFPAENADLGARLVQRAADDLQACTGRGEREVYGCLHILAAHQAAIAHRPQVAMAHLDEADEVARALGEPQRLGTYSAGFNGNWFSPTQVEIWRVAVAAELGDADEAIRVTQRIDLGALPVPNRWVYYWIDLARALAAGGKDHDAMHALAKAERAAPQHFRFAPVVRDLTATLIHRATRRATVGDMADLARKLGIAPL